MADEVRTLNLDYCISIYFPVFCVYFYKCDVSLGFLSSRVFVKNLPILSSPLLSTINF